MPRPKRHVLVCIQERPASHPRGSCRSQGGGAVYQAFAAQLASRNLSNDYQLTSTGCLGPCGHGANVLVYPESVMYGGVRPEDVTVIIDGHLLGGVPVERLQVPVEVW